MANYYLKSAFLNCPVAMTVGRRSAFINIARDWSLNINNRSVSERLWPAAQRRRVPESANYPPGGVCNLRHRSVVVRCNKLFRFNCELMTFGASVCLLRGVKVARDPCARWAHLLQALGKVLFSHLLLNGDGKSPLWFYCRGGSIKRLRGAQVLINEANGLGE